jgi:hypothetical protein
MRVGRYKICAGVASRTTGIYLHRSNDRLLPCKLVSEDPDSVNVRTWVNPNPSLQSRPYKEHWLFLPCMPNACILQHSVVHFYFNSDTTSCVSLHEIFPINFNSTLRIIPLKLPDNWPNLSPPQLSISNIQDGRRTSPIPICGVLCELGHLWP